MKNFGGLLLIGLGVALISPPATLLADAPDPEVVKKELAKLQGTWRVVGVEENGQKLPEDKLRAAKGTVVIDGDKHTLRYGDKSQGTVTVKVDPTTKPRQYDLVVPDKGGKDKLQFGIYELEGDTWKLCLNKSGAGGRPTELSGKAGSGWVLVTLKKEKPDGDKK